VIRNKLWAPFRAIANFLDEDTHRVERKWAMERLHAREVHAAHQRCWNALDEIVNALDAMPRPPDGSRMAEALEKAKAVRDKEVPW